MFIDNNMWKVVIVVVTISGMTSQLNCCGITGLPHDVLRPGAESDCWETLETSNAIAHGLVQWPRELLLPCPYNCTCRLDDYNNIAHCHGNAHSTVPISLNENTTIFGMEATDLIVLLPRSFAHMPILICLRLLNNFRLKNIMAGSFERLPDLETLIINYSIIKMINARAFAGLNRLKYLDLRDNCIVALARHCFSTLSSLKFLSLKNNMLNGFWNKKPFVNLKDLVILDVSENNLSFQVSCNINDPFTELISSTKVVILSFNHNILFRGNLFCMQNIKVLYMEKLNIILVDYDRFLPRSFFAAMKNLNILNLRSSNLIHFNININNSLQLISIMQQGIDNPSILFQNLKKAKVPSVTLQNLEKAEMLDISGTNGIVLSNETFVNSTHILRLDLSGLQIKTLDTDIFMPLVYLKNLRLANNKIESVNLSSLPRKLWRQLDEIDLSNNPFSCDCDMRWFRNWLPISNITVRDINDSSAYVCDTPRYNKGKHILSINIDYCNAASKDSIIQSLWISFVIFALISSVVALIHRFRWHVSYWQLQVQIRGRQSQEIVDQQQFTYDAFVMYSSEDTKWVRHQLLPELENDNEESLRLCVHERDWLPGTLILENIVESIELSRKCLLIVSNAFVASNWCNYEMNLVQSRSIQEDCSNTVLVMLEEIAPSICTQRLRLQMQRQTYIEWTEDEVGQRLFWTKLRQALKKSRQSLAHELPPRDEFFELR